MDTQASALTYQWQISFAVLVSLTSLMVSLVRWIVEHRQKVKQDRTRAYEEVYDDACFILSYPFEKRRLESKKKEYENTNPQLQQAVREYLNSHWMKNMWGANKLVPQDITDAHKKYEYLHLVQEEASKFEDKKWEYQLSIDLPETSPVYHFDKSDVATRFNHIMTYVGRHLSFFSDKVRRSWENAQYADPTDIRDEYEKALQVCKHFFKHNQREFVDPFYDLVEAIRADYRKMTRKKSFINDAIKVKLLILFRNIKHPVKALKERKLRNLS